MELLIKKLSQLFNQLINQQRISRIASLPLKPLMVLPVLETQINYQLSNRVFLERLSDVKKLQLYSKNSNDNFGFKKMFGI